MKLPRNGTAVANALLVLAGAVLGASATWTVVMVTKTPDVAQSGATSTSSLSARGHPPLSTRADKLATALAERDPRSRRKALREAGANAADHNLAQALEAGIGLPSERDKQDYLLGLVGRWAETDPEAALDHALNSFAPGSLQSEAIGLTMNKWGDANPREAWLWAEQHLSGPLKERAMTDLVVGWTRRTPSDAAAWLTGTGLTSQPLYNAVGRTWAEVSPLEAAAWAGSLPPGVVRQTAEVAVAGEWASQDPAAATEHFTDSLTGENGSNLTIALTDVWATTAPADTAKWIAQLPPSANRDQAAGVLATVWAASDIKAAVSWSSEISDPAMREQVITHLGTTWGAIEPDRAIAWLGTLPAAEAREGISGAFYSWAGTDPVGLQQWVDSTPDHPLADQGRLSLGDVLTSSNLPSAMNLALGMSDPDQSGQAAARFFREWRKTDDAGAQDWIQQHWDSLPANTRERLNREQALPVVPK